jgi:hypothetical protein
MPERIIILFQLPRPSLGAGLVARQTCNREPALQVIISTTTTTYPLPQYQLVKRMGRGPDYYIAQQR